MHHGCRGTATAEHEASLHPANTGSGLNMNIDSSMQGQGLFRRFMLVFLPVAAVLTAVLFSYVHFDRKLRLQTVEAEETSRLRVAGGRVEGSISAVETDLRVLAHMPQLIEYLDSGKRIYGKTLEKNFLNLSAESGRYDQIRYLDTSGKEVIRVNYNNGRPAVAPRSQLQNKKGRYYFDETLKLGKDEIYVSPLDLNIEHGKLEIPYKPTVRFGMPVFDSAGRKKGIILLNYFGSLLLQEFQATMQGHNHTLGMLLNSDGYWLNAPNPEDEWGFMLDRKERTLGHDSPEAWRAISAAERGHLITDRGLFVFSTIYPLTVRHSFADSAVTDGGKREANERQYYWKSVSFIPRTALFSNAIYNKPLSQAVIASIYFLLALAGYFFARISLSRKLAIRNTVSLNSQLESRVEELAEKEENLSVTLNSIGDGVMATDTDGCVTRLNAVAEKLTGWTGSQAIGRPVEEIFRIINQHTREPAAIPVAATLEQSAIHGLANDTVLIARDGSECQIADSCAPIRDPDGKIIGTVLVFRDVSKEYAAQAALRDSATRIQTIFNTAGDGIITIDEQGVIESMNPSAERVFGYTLAETVGQSINMLMPEPHRSQHDQYLQHYCETGEAHILGREREVEGQRKDGSTFSISLLVSEMFLGGERHFTAIVRDITARKEAESQLDLFFSLSLDMLCISSADGYFKRVSPAFTRTLGWSTEEILKRPFLFFVHPEDHEATLREVERQVAAGEKVLHFENRYLHKDGSYRVLSWMSVPHGQGLMFASARDVTDSKKMEQELVYAKERAELANRAKDSFLTTMSHEIRTPLTGMLGMLELLSLTRLDNEQHSTLDAAWESGRGLLRIVSDILDWSKIEEGKLELSLRSTSIPQLLAEVVNTYSRVASAKSLKLYQHCDTRISAAHIVDPLRLSQVLNNFVSNAIKFTPQGEVELGAEFLEQIGSGERMRFYVRDTGIGIPREAQQRLFERYRQESADTARMYGGTGLGLSICRRLADLMDGQIGLESEPGRGTTFSITLNLPVSGAPGEELQTQNLVVEQRAIKPLFADNTDAPLVLAVDDHPINRNLLARQVGLLGLRAETAENGQTALAKWQERHFDLVITDCHMPEMDGYELSREIRNIESRKRLPHTPIIAWTANALAEEAEHCRTAGMDELLVKPANLSRLKKVIAKCLSIPGTDELQAAPQRPGTSGNQRSGPIDYAELSKVVPDRTEQVEVLQDFMAHIRSDYATLLGVMEQGDKVRLERTAHRMKGSGRMVGAKELAEVCATIEQAAREGNIGGMKSALKALDNGISQLESFLLETANTGRT
jgi:two-component system, NarL family, sensor histidine kinase EvgS